jgi:mRNA interferase RelE/StbE
MAYKLILAPEAVEDLKALRAFERATVRDAMKEHLRFQPTKTSRSRIKRLRGMRHPEYRLRVDEIRIFYDVADDTVEILAIVPKSEATTWLKRYGERDDEQEQPNEENEV